MASRATKENVPDQDDENDEFYDVKGEEKVLKKKPSIREFAADCYASVQQPTFAPHPQDLGKLIPEFSEGDGVVKWLRRIDHFRTIYGWTEQMCLLYATTRLSGAASSWYRRQEEYIFSWIQFKDQLVAAFPETYDEADIHRQLEAAKITKGESYESFVYRVDALAQKGDFSTSATLKYIIKGLRDDKVYGSLLSRQYSSTLELIRHIKWVASNLDMVSTIPGPPRTPKVTGGSTLTSPTNDLTCFNCREQGHKSINCPKPPRRERCNNCHKVGHTADKCFANSTQPGARPSKWSTTNAVFNNGSSEDIIVDASSQVEADIERTQDRFRTLALIDSGSYANLIKCKYVQGKMALQKTTEDVIGINNVKVDVLVFKGIDDACMISESLDLDVGDDETTRRYKGEMESLLKRSYFDRPKASVRPVPYKAGIRLKEDKVFTATPQRLSAFEKRELDKIVEDLLEQGIIRESESPYTSRVVLTRKKNNSYRMCINYKPLNKVSERIHFPMPIIEDQIMKLQGKRFFTSLDLKNGFYHVELEEESKKYTSFVTDSGQYEFNRLPFGYSNSPAVFVKYLTKVLSPFIRDERLIVFIDDILIASKTIEEHLQTVKDVLETLADNGLELQLTKCQFVKTCVEFLGYDESVIERDRLCVASFPASGPWVRKLQQGGDDGENRTGSSGRKDSVVVPVDENYPLVLLAGRERIVESSSC
nr:uncharacterized protein K02A2.6-like [Aedes albopictus]